MPRAGIFEEQDVADQIFGRFLDVGSGIRWIRSGAGVAIGEGDIIVAGPDHIKRLTIRVASALKK